nr:uncharacterized protein LOC128696885 [Cherax quadricarinatus]
MKSCYSSKDNLSEEKDKTETKTEDADDSSYKGNTLISRIRNRYSSRESLKDASPLNKLKTSSEETWKGLGILNKLYNKIGSIDNTSEDDLNLANKSEEYWKGVNFLDKAHDIMNKLEWEDDHFLGTIEPDIKPEDRIGWLTHERKPLKDSLEKGIVMPESRRDRGRNSIISLGSLHSVSSIPTAPPPRSGAVIRNSKYSNQRRGKVARQAFRYTRHQSSRS